MIPSDSVMLLSFLNLKLRDYYKDLDALCDDLDVSKQDITEKLATIDYRYDAEKTSKGQWTVDCATNQYGHKCYACQCA